MNKFSLTTLSKSNKLKYTILGLLTIAMAYLVWGVIIEPYWIDKEKQIGQIPGLPQKWQGKQVGLISDFQVGLWLDNTRTIRRIVQQLIKERPDLVLITGDFIYEPGKNPEAELDKVAQLVRPLIEANIPTYAVLGNHDYALHSQHHLKNEKLSTQVREALESVGVNVLKNEAVPLATPGNDNPSLDTTQNQYPLYLVGIGSHKAKEDKPKKALTELPEAAPRLVMMHNPNSFEALPANTAPLAVAGHTHGGQIRLLPFDLTPVWFLLTYDEEDLVHVAGWVEDFGKSGNRLYVNRGIGFSKVPMRINARPELTLFTLKTAN